MPPTEKIVITNVHVFDGVKLSGCRAVVIDGDKIGTDSTDAVEVNGKGGVLLPGLIDAHVHLTSLQDLHRLANAGITTAFDMASWPPSVINSLRNQHGLTDVRSAGTPLTCPGSRHSRLPGLPADALISDATHAVEFVKLRVAEGSDYIKVIADIPGPDQDTLDAAVAEAKKHGKLTVAHAAAYEPVRMAQKAKVDVLTHVPMDRALTEADAEMMVKERRICIPTLAMMEGMAKLNIPGRDYKHSEDSVKTMNKAGVPILAGTDANNAPGSPSPIPHGQSLHRELELLVNAGLSTVEALRCATEVNAMHFGLADRGVIKPGLRADLVLIADDPIKDISAIRGVQRVWCAGVEVKGT